MDNEFDKIINLFSLESEEKEKRLDEIFHLSMQFIEKYKYIQHEGTPAEKETITKKLNILREKISKETASSETFLDLSKEEIKELSNNEKNFSQEQWKLLQKTRETLNSEKLKLKEKQQSSLKNSIAHIKPATNKKKKTKRGRSSWLKS